MVARRKAQCTYLQYCLLLCLLYLPKANLPTYLGRCQTTAVHKLNTVIVANEKMKELARTMQPASARTRPSAR